jgi:hypothetical protein
MIFPLLLILLAFLLGFLFLVFSKVFLLQVLHHSLLVDEGIFSKWELHWDEWMVSLKLDLEYPISLPLTLRNFQAFRESI